MNNIWSHISRRHKSSVSCLLFAVVLFPFSASSSFTRVFNFVNLWIRRLDCEYPLGILRTVAGSPCDNILVQVARYFHLVLRLE
ncbi:hypothetical protein DL96DRAFT_1638537 [Flagelloscypha sp. PMI_526]|nr:hypothetical protein DL96DRAFT_1638537 [Flagelloscypha sp. PMI_526]